MFNGRLITYARRKKIQLLYNLYSMKMHTKAILHAPEWMMRTTFHTESLHLLNRRMLKISGVKMYSQNDEDGIIDYIMSVIGATNRYFVEIGVGTPYNGKPDSESTGLECNCRRLAESGWNGLYIDGNKYPERYGVKQAFVTAENINDIFTEQAVPYEFDVFSLDIDGNDYWVWKALRHRPRVVVIEYNAAIPMTDSKTIPYDPHFDWAAGGCTQYYGASLLALFRLGLEKGYTLVHANGVNAFFVNRDLVPNSDEFYYYNIYRYSNRHKPLRGDEPWVEIAPSCEFYI